MNIYFVMGISCSGKSTYIKNNFPNAIVIDLFDFQTNKRRPLTKDIIMESYQECMDALIQRINENKDKNVDIVMEHTLLRGIRRKPYIDAIRNVCDAPITAIVIIPPMYKLIERNKLRGFSGDATFIQDNLDVLEIPTIDEGFLKVEIVKE